MAILYEQKKALRQWVREERSRYTPAYRAYADAEICRKILTLPAYTQAKTVLFFVAKQNEIQTRTLLQQAWNDGKRVLVPRCAEKGCMDAYAIVSMEDLQRGQYGIDEPKLYCALVAKKEIDFAVIPCMAADPYGNRLGYGGGYYDRYLADTTFCKATICYERLLLPMIPTEAHDKKMDIVVTEQEVFELWKDA